MQRDYILRMIEQMGAMLVALRKMIVGREIGLGDAEDRLRSVTGKIGLDLEVARVATAETLELMIAPTGEVEPGRCWLLAESLHLDGLNGVRAGVREEAWASLEKALRLYSLLEPGRALSFELPEAGERMAEIRSILKGTG